MKDSTRNFITGLVSLGALGVLVALLLMFGELRWLVQSSYRVTVAANIGGGLRKGSQVQLNGVPIGEVASVTVRPSEEPPVRVEADINFDIDLPQSCEISCESALIGGGSRLNFRMPNDPAARTAMAPRDGTWVASAEFMTFEDRIASIVSEDFTELARNLNELVAPLQGGPDDPANQGSIRTSVTRLNRMLASAEEAFDGANSWLHDEQLHADAKSAVWKASQLIDQASAAMDAVAGAAKGIEGQAGTLAADLRPVIERMRQTLEHVQAISEKVNAGEGTVGQLVNNPDLYRSLEDAGRRLAATLAEVELLVAKIKDEGLRVEW
ncbi:MAG: MCE family protein [Phycisphaerae bacterium]|nr:MCE family protein [Phycisphaerae bacterium]